jgi:uncharacterized protein YjeT (DUF2065 family)
MKSENNSKAVRFFTALSALMFVIPGLMLIFTPRLFYDLLADFPPYNQHFMGDAGAFSLGIGIALLMALRNPAQHRAVLWGAFVAAMAHVLNHAYSDFIVGHEPLRHGLTNTLPLALAALLLAWSLAKIHRNG